MASAYEWEADLNVRSMMCAAENKLLVHPNCHLRPCINCLNCKTMSES